MSTHEYVTVYFIYACMEMKIFCEVAVQSDHSPLPFTSYSSTVWLVVQASSSTVHVDILHVEIGERWENAA